jgi:PhoPQ-activated pathogenicity-related protein
VTNLADVIEDYLAAKDASFRWRLCQTTVGAGYTSYLIDLTSQCWAPELGLDRPIWKHWLKIIIPQSVQNRHAFLQISGGSNLDEPDSVPSERLVRIAKEALSIVVEVSQVPNQPMRFEETPDLELREDDLIAYLQARYDPATRPFALLRLPMIKSVVSAMTAVQEFCAEYCSGLASIDGFVVSGASKRGWAAWLVGVFDPRVVGIVPVVLNTLSVENSIRHDWQAKGFFSPALSAYHRQGIIPAALNTDRFRSVNLVEDPVAYLDRPGMRIPKYVINASGDEYFAPDNTRYSFGSLPGRKWLRLIPNCNHGMTNCDPVESIIAWFVALSRNEDIPECTWALDESGRLTIDVSQPPTRATLWAAHNEAARDFRVDAIGRSFVSTNISAVDGRFHVQLSPPLIGFSCSFVEFEFAGSGIAPHIYTTEAIITPDILPFRWPE